MIILPKRGYKIMKRNFLKFTIFILFASCIQWADGSEKFDDPKKLLGYDPKITGIPKKPGKKLLLVSHGFNPQSDQKNSYKNTLLPHKGYNYAAVICPNFKDRGIVELEKSIIELFASINLGQSIDAQTLLYAGLKIIDAGHKFDIYAHSRGCAATQTMKDIILNPKKYVDILKKFELTKKVVSEGYFWNSTKDVPDKSKINNLKNAIGTIIYNKPLLDLRELITKNPWLNKQHTWLKYMISKSLLISTEPANILFDTASLSEKVQPITLIKEHLKQNKSVGNKTYIILGGKTDKMLGDACNDELIKITKDCDTYDVAVVDEGHNVAKTATNLCHTISYGKKVNLKEMITPKPKPKKNYYDSDEENLEVDLSPDINIPEI